MGVQTDVPGEKKPTSTGRVVGVRSDVQGDYRTFLSASGCGVLVCACVIFVVKE